jgi:hypothetical protein
MRPRHGLSAALVADEVQLVVIWRLKTRHEVALKTSRVTVVQYLLDGQELLG